MDPDVCRVCRCGGEEQRPLRHPCKCSGSIASVHQECLEEWLRHSQHVKCELCGVPYVFEPIYDKDAPSRLSILEFVRIGLIGRSSALAKRITRLIFVFSIWVILIPLALGRGTRWLLWTFEDASLTTLVNDLVRGLIVVPHIVVLLFAVQAFMEYLRSHPEVLLFRGVVLEADHNAEEEADDEVDEPEPEPQAEVNAAVALAGLLEAEGNAPVDDGPIPVENVGFMNIAGFRGPLLPFLRNAFSMLILLLCVVLLIIAWPAYVGREMLWVAGVSKDSTVVHILIGYVAGALFFRLVFAFEHIGNYHAPVRLVCAVVLFAYLFCKVAVLLMIEMVFFPILNGVFLTICVTRSTAVLSFSMISLFSLWFYGIIIMISLSWLVSQLRHSLASRVLWFLRNPEEPGYDHIMEQLKWGPLRHLRRIGLSVLLYATVTMTAFGIPIYLAGLSPHGTDSFNVLFLPLTPLSALIFTSQAPDALTRVIYRAVLSWFRYVGDFLGMHNYFWTEPDTLQREGNQWVLRSTTIPDIISDSPLQIIAHIQASDGHLPALPMSQFVASLAFADIAAPHASEEIATRILAQISLSHYEARIRPAPFNKRTSLFLACGWISTVSSMTAILFVPFKLGKLLPINSDVDWWLWMMTLFMLVIAQTVISRIYSALHHDHLLALLKKVMPIAGRFFASFTIGFLVAPLLLGFACWHTLCVPLLALPDQSISTPSLLYILMIGMLAVNTLTIGLYISAAWRPTLNQIGHHGFQQINDNPRVLLFDFFLPLAKWIVPVLPVPYALGHTLFRWVLCAADDYMCSLWVVRWQWIIVGAILMALLMLHLAYGAVLRLHASVRDEIYLVGRRLRDRSTT